MAATSRPASGGERSRRMAAGAALAFVVLASGCGGGGNSPPAATAGCANGIVTDPIRAALVQANGLPGGQAIPGRTYYGTCGPTSYAVARFQPAAGATFEQRVSFQDDGNNIRFFTKPAGGAWTVVGMVAYDLTPTCAPFPLLPSALRAQWEDCPRA